MTQDPAIISALIEKARNKLITARLAFDAGQYDDSVSRGYYAVFNALTAILYKKNLIFSKHGQVIGAFNREFVKTGIFPAEYSRQIDGLFKDRQIGDYHPAPAINREAAAIHVKNAEIIVGAIAEFFVQDA